LMMIRSDPVNDTVAIYSPLLNIDVYNYA